jgi:hypothetical protein
MLCLIIAYEAQTGRCCIEPPWETGLEECLDEEQLADRKVCWSGQVNINADCMAVMHATNKPGSTVRDQFKFGGCYKHEGYQALGLVQKVDAHKGREQAKAEGWEVHWRGNDAADQVAKQVRPKEQGDEQEQRLVIAAVRSRRRVLFDLCTRLATLWEAMFRNKKTYIRVDRAGDKSTKNQSMMLRFIWGSGYVPNAVRFSRNGTGMVLPLLVILGA